MSHRLPNLEDSASTIRKHAPVTDFKRRLSASISVPSLRQRQLHRIQTPPRVQTANLRGKSRKANRSDKSPSFSGSGFELSNRFSPKKDRRTRGLNFVNQLEQPSLDDDFLSSARRMQVDADINDIVSRFNSIETRREVGTGHSSGAFSAGSWLGIVKHTSRTENTLREGAFSERVSSAHNNSKRGSIASMSPRRLPPVFSTSPTLMCAPTSGPESLKCSAPQSSTGSVSSPSQGVDRQSPHSQVQRAGQSEWSQTHDAYTDTMYELQQQTTRRRSKSPKDSFNGDLLAASADAPITGSTEDSTLDFVDVIHQMCRGDNGMDEAASLADYIHYALEQPTSRPGTVLEADSSQKPNAQQEAAAATASALKPKADPESLFGKPEFSLHHMERTEDMGLDFGFMALKLPSRETDALETATASVSAAPDLSTLQPLKIQFAPIKTDTQLSFLQPSDPRWRQVLPDCRPAPVLPNRASAVLRQYKASEIMDSDEQVRSVVQHLVVRRTAAITPGLDQKEEIFWKEIDEDTTGTQGLFTDMSSAQLCPAERLIAEQPVRSLKTQRHSLFSSSGEVSRSSKSEWGQDVRVSTFPPLDSRREEEEELGEQQVEQEVETEDVDEPLSGREAFSTELRHSAQQKTHKKKPWKAIAQRVRRLSHAFVGKAIETEIRQPLQSKEQEEVAPPAEGELNATEEPEGQEETAEIDANYHPEKDTLFVKCRNHRRAAVEEMFARHVPVDLKDHYGNQCLHIACQNGDKSIVKACLRWGADIDAQNLQGQTPLHYCFAYGFEKLATYLLSKGAKDSILNVFGLSCYDGLRPNS
mmetsp:Transcript_29850/g.58474  ORF Transcript_29850/g.58474 Transcript_29850/m.58474 type:complete len:816 (+) Transcript_29850:8-2455(+)